MKNIKFTKIEKHNLKSIFGNEPQFTKWFEEEGKNYIEETLGIALKDIHTEQPVGNYYLENRWHKWWCNHWKSIWNSRS